jgi:hypothetical protein
MSRYNRHRCLLAALVLTFSMNAAASDFNVLWVGVGTLVIACMLIAIGIKASFVAKAKAKARCCVIPYLFAILLLSEIGLAIVFDEKDHMSQLDTWGMFGMVLIPGILSFFIPLLLSSSTARE